MQELHGNLYDYPSYYDLVFGSDWAAELRFLKGCFQRYASSSVERVFEPACGTGRLLFRLARDGFEVSGLDLNPRAVAYCNDRLRRHGYRPTATVGDMTDFRLSRRQDAAFNMINSFRHLLTETAAVRHLQCVTESLRIGGIYVLGLHLTPTEIEPTEEESWSARRGNLAVNTRLWTTHRDLRTREERFEMRYEIHTPSNHWTISDTIAFRTYTAKQMLALIRRVPALELVETFDFAYDLKSPTELNAAAEDTVFVLRKRSSTGRA